MGTIVPMAKVLSDAAKRPAVVADAEQLISDEVSAKKGFSGTLLKSGFAVVKRLKKGIINEVIEALLDEFCEAIEPLHADYRAAPDAKGFGVVLERNADAATNALLGVTDKRAERTANKVIQKTYEKLRPRAEEHVRQALPGLGTLIDKHTLG